MCVQDLFRVFSASSSFYKAVVVVVVNMRMRFFFLSVSQLTWLLLVVVVVIPANRFGTSATSVTTTAEQQQQECSMQQDGTCLPLTTTTTDAADTTTTTTVTTKPEDDCPDMNETCDYWASLGECDANPKYMLHNCRKSCHVCHWTKSQITREVNQRLGVGTKDDKKEEEEVVDLTETPYGVTQSTASANKEEELKLQETIQNMTNYMEQIVFQDPGHVKVKKECKNR